MIEAYFEHQDNYVETFKCPDGTIKQALKPRPYTIAGLVLFLGFATRDSLTRYIAVDEEYAELIGRAYLRIEEQLSESLSGAKGAIAGPIFALKCGFGWREESGTPQNQTTNIQINTGGGAVGLAGLPPEPKSLEEWAQMYDSHLGQKQLVAEPEPIGEPTFIEASVDDIIEG